MSESLAHDSGLLIYPPEPVRSAIDAWRRIYNPRWEDIAPHVTVSYPPFVPEGEWLRVRPVVAEVARAFPPFDVTLQRFGTFAIEEYVLWLEPEDDGSLERLHAALRARLPDYMAGSQYAYVPHLTLAFFDTETALHGAMDALAAQIAPLRFRADALTYVVLGADGRWRDRDWVSFGAS